MNRIYHQVWNVAQRRYVVAPESAHGGQVGGLPSASRMLWMATMGSSLNPSALAALGFPRSRIFPGCSYRSSAPG